MDQQAPLSASAALMSGSRTISRSTTGRVASVAVECSSTMMLSMLAVALVNCLFIVSILHYRFQPRLMLLYFALVLLYAALYFRRRLRRHNLRRRPGLRRGLGYAAIVLVAFISALFFCSFAASPAAMPPPVGVAVWLVLAVAAYFFYRVTVLHLEDDDEEAQAAMQTNVAHPV